MAIRTVNALYEHAEKKGWEPEKIAVFHRKRNDKIVAVARRGRVNA